MQAPSTPVNEDSRLKSLKELDILDTQPEERFDRITRMAKRLFDVPIALVSLVDENRQWFKSCFGVDASETPRDISFCGHAILGDETFQIEDALSDPRFADNPLVTGYPHIRFYAGHPLSTPDGEKIGTLCIIDTKPKSLSADDLVALNDLAVMVEQELAALQLASTDELTCISNRRGFMKLADYSYAMCRRQKISLAIAYMDLDQFKPINDEHGHAEGDRALKLFAEQMCGSFRESDLFARMGGDEFVVLFTDTEAADAKEILQRFAADLEAAAEENKLAYTLRFSFGLLDVDFAAFPSIESALEQADQLMYQQKSCQR
ncbi:MULTISPECIES: sensor domain-containing diguanylate cyclase [unclassified Agarivorans]|uniref:sensor domain-containing diguanylate cyclase n=1 Tax=unclassified Agarivorans TaxID=2636026 RepID=UPI0026E24DA1|nr:MULTISPECIES: sensor domain-containing diguanylate cyclase [unclassified Agarivorans]MDO6687275.1 sensor domain-containing diguanylate cyclase [Agarivorans sp. 3_MG-2023]MDO6716798.1 sensor domain-containing diguanylate cyclase [Agarivorans sp. 2_MG-2023]